MGSPMDYLTKTSTGCGTVYNASGQQIRWYAEAGNWPDHIWKGGDTCIVLGSWDPNEGTFDHAGEYWLFSDTLDPTLDTESWAPSDTMRVMPMPVASAVPTRADTVDTVIIEIENPYETDRAPWGTEEYDVLGYWIVLDTTGTGVESFFDVVLGFAPVVGGPGASTFFQYSLADILPVGFVEYDLYHAYYIVARPETTATPGVCPGFSTPNMSQNSNLLTVVGVAEHNNTVPTSFSARPSVFTERTRFSVVIPEQALVNIKLYDAAGQLVSTVCDEVMTAGSHTIEYDGAALPSGVYFYTLQTNQEQLSGQIVKLH